MKNFTIYDIVFEYKNENFCDQLTYKHKFYYNKKHIGTICSDCDKLTDDVISDFKRLVQYYLDNNILFNLDKYEKRGFRIRKII